MEVWWPDFPQMEPTDELDAPSRRIPEHLGDTFPDTLRAEEYHDRFETKGSRETDGRHST